MRLPVFIEETRRQLRADRLWAAAFIATLLLPLMLIYARAGIEICCAIIGIAFLIHSARAKNWQWLRAPFTLVCFAMWAWLVLIVTPLAITPKAGLVEALLWFRLPLLFAALRYWVLAQPAARAMLGVVLLVLVSLIALDCFAQFFTGMSLTGHARLASGRLTGPFSGPKVGYFLGQLVIPAVALCLMAARRKRHTLLVLGLLAAAIVAIIFSGERSAFLTTMLAVATTLGLLMLAEKRLRVIGFALAVLVIAGLAGLYVASPWVQLRAGQALAVMGNYWQTDYGILARAGLDIGEAHPLHGAGLHGYRDLSPTVIYNGDPFHGLHPHNAFIEWFAETGVPGLLLFVLSIILLAKQAVGEFCRVPVTYCLAPAAALGVLVQHFFPFMGMQSAFNNWSALLQWYGLALVFAAMGTRGAEKA